MIQRDGWWFPDEDQTFHTFHPKECERDVPWFLANVEGRGTVIQAGALVGMYPIALAGHFQQVITFEPNQKSWACMQVNRYARDSLRRVVMMPYALGEKPGKGFMVNPKPENMGAFRVIADDGEGQKVKITTIDNIAPIDALDAIWLDVEGMELAALKGAEQTIRRFSPVIVTEENGNGSKYGTGECDIEEYLQTLGYECECGIGNDRLYRRTK